MCLIVISYNLNVLVYLSLSEIRGLNGHILVDPRTVRSLSAYAHVTRRMLLDSNTCNAITVSFSQCTTSHIDMRFHWIRDRIAQKQFIVTWRKGADNLADFFTKPLPVHVHQSLMPLLVHIPPATPAAQLTSSAARAEKWRSSKTRQTHLTGSPCVT